VNEVDLLYDLIPCSLVLEGRLHIVRVKDRPKKYYDFLIWREYGGWSEGDRLVGESTLSEFH